MEEFDKKKFDTLTIDDRFGKFANDYHYRTKDKNIRVIYHADYISVLETDDKTPYEVYKKYSTKTNLLTQSVVHFSLLPIGILREYDETGNLIKETDYDKDFPFSLDSLIEKMKKEYNYDILDKNKVGTSRYFLTKDINNRWDIDINKPVYVVEVFFPEIGRGNLSDNFLFDGKTGELLIRAKQTFREDELYLSIEKLYHKAIEEQQIKGSDGYYIYIDPDYEEYRERLEIQYKLLQEQLEWLKKTK